MNKTKVAQQGNFCKKESNQTSKKDTRGESSLGFYTNSGGDCVFPPLAGVNTSQIMEYNHRSLGISLILCPFSQIIIVGFLLGSMLCLATGSWPDNGAR